MEPAQNIIEQAKKELAEEQFREKVEAYKEKLKQKRTFWDRIFPYKLIVIKKEDLR